MKLLKEIILNKGDLYNVFDKLDITKITPNLGKCVIDGTEYVSTNRKIKDIVRPLLSSDSDKLALIDMDDSEFSAHFKEYLALTLDQIKEEEENGLKQISERYKRFSVDSDKPEDYVVFDTVSNKTLHWKHFARLYPKECNKLEVLPCVEVYEPEILENIDKLRYEEDGHGEYAIVNTYNVPEARVKVNRVLRPLIDVHYNTINRPKTYELPPLAKEFFQHLFPLKKARHYVYEWIFHALIAPDGNETILCLHSNPGVGKSTLSDSVFPALFGEENVKKLSSSQLKTFNGSFKNTRMAVLDEVKVTYESQNKLKGLTNPKITIQDKYQREEQGRKKYSIVAMFNNISDWYVDFNDRRSSFVDITDKRLDSFWDSNTIREFRLLCENDEGYKENLLKFFLTRSWLKPTDKELTYLKQYKSAVFNRFVQSHLTVWQKKLCKEIFDYIAQLSDDARYDLESEDYYDVSGFVEVWNEDKRTSYDISDTRAIEFLKGYLHEDRGVLGSVINVNEGSRVPFSEKYVLKINPLWLGIEEELDL